MGKSSSGKNGADAELERGTWSHQIEFFLSLLGYSVGIGNIVRFPYLCLKHGGGAFVVPFFVAHLVCGIPLFILELLLGQFSGLSPFKLWEFCPLFKGIGYSMAAISLVCALYYNMLIAFCLFYLFSSFTTTVPWQSCGNPWNSDKCWSGSSPLTSANFLMFNGTATSAVNITTASVLSNFTVTESNSTYVNSTALNKNIVWASDEFWHRRVLGISDSFENIGAMRWELVLCLLAAWGLVFLSLAWGVKWTGKVVYVTATMPYILLIALVVRGCTLPGAAKGLYFYSVPKFEKLMLAETWISATVQMFYSLGPAWGGLITMASYNPFRHKCNREGIIAPSLDMVTALFGGVAIFSIIGFMAEQAGLSIDDVARSGPGLSFIVYPLALAQLPGAPIWSAVFFLTLITLGIDSMFGTFETVLSGLFDAVPRLRKHHVLVVGVCCIIAFLIGLIFCTEGGMYLYILVDWYCAVITVPLIALFEIIAVVFVYGLRRFSEDVKLMLDKPPNLLLKLLWLVATPLVLLLVLIVGLVELKVPSYGKYEYPYYAHYIGLALALSTTLPMPIAAFWVLWKTEPDSYPENCGGNCFNRFLFNFYSRLRRSVMPSDKWMPNDKTAQEHYKNIKKRWEKSDKVETATLQPMTMFDEDKDQDPSL